MKTLAVILAVLFCLPLLFFAVRAAVVHVRANRKGRSRSELLQAARLQNRNRREENRTRREILRKLMADGRLIK